MRVVLERDRITVPWGTFVYRLDRRRFVLGGALMPFSGARLAAARLAAEMTQEQLARSIGSDQARVSEWERGLFSPRPGQVPALAGAVAAVAQQARVELDRRKVLLKDPIKTLGQHTVPVKLHPDVEFVVTIDVVAG